MDKVEPVPNASKPLQAVKVFERTIDIVGDIYGAQHIWARYPGTEIADTLLATVHYSRIQDNDAVYANAEKIAALYGWTPQPPAAT